MLTDSTLVLLDVTGSYNPSILTGAIACNALCVDIEDRHDMFDCSWCISGA